MIEALLKPEVQKFIRDHENDDPSALILQAKQFPHINIKLAVEQIQSRKKAKQKLPTWYNSKDLIFPPPLSIEQSSSEKTAIYKASLFNGDRFLDLTGGMGIDFSFIAQSFKSAFYVERQGHLVALAKHNMASLKLTNAQFYNQEADDFIKKTAIHFDLIYLDPARRGTNQRKVFRVQDCEPNFIELLPLLKEKSERIIIKMSPLLDIKGAIADIGGVTEVQVIAINNEVKELLFIIDKRANLNPDIRAIDLQIELVDFKIKSSAEESLAIESSQVNEYLYEPNVALLKAGAFKSVAVAYGAQKLNANTHLYTSKLLIPDFPGRSFKVVKELKMNKAVLKTAIPDMKANITVRNYPMTVDQIRKKTGLTDGGNQYIFATTDQDGKKVVLCKKV